MTEPTAKLTEQELDDFGKSVGGLNKAIINVMPYLHAMHKEQQIIVQQWRQSGIASLEADERLQRDFGVINDRENINLSYSDAARVQYVRDRIDNEQTRNLATRAVQAQPLAQRQQQTAAVNINDAATRQSAATFVYIAPESLFALPIEKSSPQRFIATKTVVAPAPKLYEPEYISIV